MWRRACASSSAFTTAMGPAPATIRSRRSGSTGGWMTSFIGRTRLALELLRQQCHQPPPGVLVGGLAVLHPRNVVFVRARHREAMHRVGVAHELVLHAGGVEPVPEGLDRLV